MLSRMLPNVGLYFRLLKCLSELESILMVCLFAYVHRKYIFINFVFSWWSAPFNIKQDFLDFLLNEDFGLPPSTAVEKVHRSFNKNTNTTPL